MSEKVLIDPVVPEKEARLVEKIFAGIEERVGFVPAGLRLYAISPPLLQAFVSNVGYFMGHERMSQKLLAFVRYLVSSEANCRFCIDYNASILMQLGVSAEQLQAAQTDVDAAPLEKSEKALLKIALAAVNAPEAVSAEDIAAARALGWTERDVFDVVAGAASNKAFTQVLRTFKVEDQAAFG